jgi:hypothetical protein
VNQLKKTIQSVEVQLSLNAWLKAILLAVSLRLVIDLFGVDSMIVSALLGILVVALAVWLGGLKRQRNKAIQLIHQRSGNLEFSLELLEKDKYSIGEQLQLERISAQLPQRIRIFHQGIGIYLILLLVVYGLTWVFPVLQNQSSSAPLPNPKNNELAVKNALVTPILLAKVSVEINSPPYTQIPKKTQESLEVKAIKGSVLTWILGFENGNDLEVFLVNSSGEKLKFSTEGSGFYLKDELINSGLYSIQAFKDGTSVFQSDFYALESVEDRSPEIIPEEKQSYRFFFPGNNPKINLKAQISDDFLVQEVEIVATLARGKGENVKFREARFSVEKSPFTTKNSSLSLDVSALDFKPGDELYYYWAARDNKSPEANYSRTDTYFIKYYDEKEDMGMAMEGMAIQVLPEYFRSQRQIIIDTEKLIAEKGKKVEKDFNFTSNEIGYDQKLLRLRYGQYLGEEFESAAGGAIEDADDGDLLRGFMHLHDQEGEHDPDFRPTQPKHESHDEASGSTESGGIESLLSEYMHAHDSEELNTYYEQSTRGALKSALDQMWQAELYLRLFEPEKSLPYQYKALEMLKTVQQKSRVYIKKTGYDPPPIKEEEKRLTGELKNLEKQIQKEQAALTQQIEPLASAVLGFLLKSELSAADKTVVRELGILWTQRMQNSSMEDWKLLRFLSELETGSSDEPGKNYIREKLYPFARNYKPTGASYLSPNALRNSFRKHLP